MYSVEEREYDEDKDSKEEVDRAYTTFSESTVIWPFSSLSIA